MLTCLLNNELRTVTERNQIIIHNEFKNTHFLLFLSLNCRLSNSVDNVIFTIAGMQKSGILKTNVNINFPSIQDWF